MSQFRLLNRELFKFRVWEDVEEALLADRETIFTASDSTANLNTAISDMSNSGGGVVRIDGMHTMDANIAMCSNVILMGYGAGTGIQNTSATNYEIQFIGTTPTYYGIGAPGDKTDFFTCDTVAQATNFVAGDYVILKDNTGSYAKTNGRRIKTTGDGGTGVVEIYENIHNYHSTLTASAQAAPLTGAIDRAGLVSMNLAATSTGTLNVVFRYATDCSMFDVVADKCTTIIDQSIDTRIEFCKFFADTSLAHGSHIQLHDWTTKTNINNCEIKESVYGVYFVDSGSGATAHESLNINSNVFGSAHCIYLYPNTTSKACIAVLSISNNTFVGMENPASGGGGGSAITTIASCIEFQIVNNIARGDTSVSGGFNLNAPSYAHYKGVIANNYTNGNITIVHAVNCMISNNGCAGILQGNAMLYCSIMGNMVDNYIYMRDQNVTACQYNVVVGNYCEGFYLEGDNTYKFSRNVIAGNVSVGNLTLLKFGQDNTIVGNNIIGAATLTAAASDAFPQTTFVGNNVDGAVTWTEANQDYCIQLGNATDGTMTDLTGGGGTGNINADNTEY